MVCLFDTLQASMFVLSVVPAISSHSLPVPSACALLISTSQEFVAAFLFAMLAGVTYDALTIAAAFAATS